MKYDICGIGSPLIDLLAKVDETLIARLGVDKGGMFLFSDEDLQRVYMHIEEFIVKTTPGDSTANTIVGASNLGAKTSYIGKIGEDVHGKMFDESLTKENVISLLKSSKVHTGKVIALITPDSQRTMVVNLGASKELDEEDIDEEDIKNSNIFHVTGYQLEEPKLKAASMKALKVAKQNGVKISIDLADFNLVKRNLDFLKEVIEEYADIVFANEDEAEAFTDMLPEEALREISNHCDIAVVKIGSEGSMIKKGDEIINIPSFKVKAVDTTGAGDMYAAGFLYGLSKGLELKKCGKIGSYAASKVVSQIGARLDSALIKEIKDKEF
jgi:sugar/nucleoside kinase (ribokinase family)